MSCKTLGGSPPPSVRVSSGFTITAGMKEMFGMSLIARPWQKVCLFVMLVYGISAPFEYLAIQSGSMGGGGGLYALGGMWSPAVAAMIMKLLFRKETAPFGWRWGAWRYQIWSAIVPFLYTLLAYGLVWSLGLGDLLPEKIIPRATRFLQGAIVPGLLLAVGEEIGWQGYMVPEVAAHYGFTAAGLTRGIVWSVWHYPMIIAGIYGNETPVWYNLVCFTLLLTSTSIIYAWLRLKSGSLWTGAIMHASHNGLIQVLFTPITLATGVTAYFIDEFGAATALAGSVAAYLFWRKRADLPTMGAGAVGKLAVRGR